MSAGDGEVGDGMKRGVTEVRTALDDARRKQRKEQNSFYPRKKPDTPLCKSNSEKRRQPSITTSTPAFALWAHGELSLGRAEVHETGPERV